MTTLDQLKNYSKVVADTGDFRSIEAFQPLDATTNPSLILKAANDAAYHFVIEDAIAKAGVSDFSATEQVDQLINRLSVGFGCQILKLVPGRVSTEVPSKFSFDAKKTIASAKEIIALYSEAGIDTDRILIKIAATWEGIQAAAQLEKEGIKTNLTLVFNISQAIACAESGITLISPFVGRISDWYKNSGTWNSEVDPGVQSVTDIYNYFKHFGYSTEIMAASFRNAHQIKALAGCDLITISPNLLDELKSSDVALLPTLKDEKTNTMEIERIPVDESNFRWNLTQDSMAVEKLADGIRRFHMDYITLVDLLANFKK